MLRCELKFDAYTLFADIFKCRYLYSVIYTKKRKKKNNKHFHLTLKDIFKI